MIPRSITDPPNPMTCDHIPTYFDFRRNEYFCRCGTYTVAVKAVRNLVDEFPRPVHDTAMPTPPKPWTPIRIQRRELQLGDTISLLHPVRYWDCAKVTRIHEGQATVFRPHMLPGDQGYPSIGIEVITYPMDDQIVELIRREE